MIGIRPAVALVTPPEHFSARPLRRERLTGPAIALKLGMARSTVGLVLRRLVLGPYASSDDRAQAIGPWTDAYNLSRPHSAIPGITPWQRVNNLLGNDS